jgi:Ca2+/Na+ antiporter
MKKRMSRSIETRVLQRRSVILLLLSLLKRIASLTLTQTLTLTLFPLFLALVLFYFVSYPTEDEIAASKAAAKENKKKAGDPTKWLSESKEGLDWFTSKHGEFDRETFEKEEAAKVAECAELKENERKKRAEIVDKELKDMRGDNQTAAATTASSKKKTRKSGKKVENASDVKRKELMDLMNWAK